MSTAALPRPLAVGEFYCHTCQKFVKWVDHEAHQKEHLIKARRHA
jgi:hypothetical protein